MQRREAIASRDEGRRPRNLYAWDCFLGVPDFTRQGAIRVCPKDKHADTFNTKNFLDDHPLSAPPLTRLRELEAIGCHSRNGYLFLSRRAHHSEALAPKPILPMR